MEALLTGDEKMNGGEGEGWMPEGEDGGCRERRLRGDGAAE